MSQDSSSLPVVARIEHLKTFDTPDDFNKYYAKHKAEIDTKSTLRLNREYTVPGYKIYRNNWRVENGVKVGDLHLKLITAPSAKNNVDTLSDAVQDLYAKVEQLNELYQQMASVVNGIIAGQ